MKKYLPKWAKVRYQIFKRYWREHIHYQHQFVLKKHHKINQNNFEYPFQISTQQEIKPSSFFENKTHNIDLCIQHLNGLIILPEHVFSFWHLIPEPSVHNGFKHGRNLINGEVSEDVGGGICQVSCILYMTALKSGLKIIERHAHSIDIYQEHERFTPLGSDATLVYGYKDLQFKNTFDMPIQIHLRRDHDVFTAQFRFTKHLVEKTILFSVENKDQLKYVTTYADHQVTNLSTYKIL